MITSSHLRSAWNGFLAAMQFLTRIPVPSQPYEADPLARAVMFFPLVGLIVGCGAALVHLLVAPHLPRLASAFLVLAYLVVITGGLHEDALADAADGFGGGTTAEKVLLILHDSRIGSFGGVALIFSLLARVILIAAMPLPMVAHYLIASNVLCRWTVLPLSYFLSPARSSMTKESQGQGARIAQKTTAASLIAGSIFSFATAAVLLRRHSIGPILGVILIAWLTGAYYRRRIGGVTGDCFGATIQLAESSVYLCGAWIV